MLKINVNNKRYIEIEPSYEIIRGEVSADGAFIKHKAHNGTVDKMEHIASGEIITLLNIYNYAKEKGFKLDNIANDLLDKIDEIEETKASLNALNNLVEQMKEEERSEK